MAKAFVLAAIVGALSFPVPAVAANQPEAVDAAMAAAERIAQCPDCEFYLGKRPVESAQRGLVDIGIEALAGGGYHMLMAYTGTRWARLWEGNGSTRNVGYLPSRTVICMDEGGRTNLRNGPGLDYERIGKVTRPTSKKVFEVRMTKPLGKREGEAWYRIRFNGDQAWVQNLRTLAPWLPKDSTSEMCEQWRSRWSKRQ